MYGTFPQRTVYQFMLGNFRARLCTDHLLALVAVSSRQLAAYSGEPFKQPKGGPGEWQNRVENWKFADARTKMPKTHPDYALVECLAGLFGNCGWFDGEIGALVEMVVERIIAGEIRLRDR
jgi:hypothetical protein